MKLSELDINQRVAVQIIWGERKIEFFSYVVDKTDVSILVTPYIHNNRPLELNIDAKSNVVCNIFAELPQETLKVWKSAELRTVQDSNGLFYYISHKRKNKIIQHIERRQHERIPIYKMGRLLDKETFNYYGVEILNISNSGIAFAVNSNVDFMVKPVTVTFSDFINGNRYNMSVECMPIRTEQMEDGYLWGCKIIDENKDFNLYSFVMKTGTKKEGSRT